jgi:hypothetical protein
MVAPKRSRLLQVFHLGIVRFLRRERSTVASEKYHTIGSMVRVNSTDHRHLARMMNATVAHPRHPRSVSALAVLDFILQHSRSARCRSMQPARHPAQFYGQFDCFSEKFGAVSEVLQHPIQLLLGQPVVNVTVRY